MTQSQKNCLIIALSHPANDRTERYKSFLRFSVFMRRKAFSFALNLADTRNSDSSVTRLKINLFNEVFYR